MRIATWRLTYQRARTYLWPDRPNDDYPRAKYVWIYFALGYLLYFAWLAWCRFS